MKKAPSTTPLVEFDCETSVIFGFIPWRFGFEPGIYKETRCSQEEQRQFDFEDGVQAGQRLLFLVRPGPTHLFTPVILGSSEENLHSSAEFSSVVTNEIVVSLSPSESH